jgi:hypothetical protein
MQPLFKSFFAFTVHALLGMLETTPNEDAGDNHHPDPPLAF